MASCSLVSMPRAQLSIVKALFFQSRGLYAVVACWPTGAMLTPQFSLPPPIDLHPCKKPQTCKATLCEASRHAHDGQVLGWALQ